MADTMKSIQVNGKRYPTCSHCQAIEEVMVWKWIANFAMLALVSVGIALSIVMIMTLRKRELRNWAHDFLIAIAIIDILDLGSSAVDVFLEPVFCILPGFLHFVMSIVMSLWLMAEFMTHVAAVLLTCVLTLSLCAASYSRRIRNRLHNSTWTVPISTALSCLCGTFVAVAVIIAIRPYPCFDTFLGRLSTDFKIYVYKNDFSSFVYDAYIRVGNILVFNCFVLVAVIVLVCSCCCKIPRIDLSGGAGIQLRAIFVIVAVQALNQFLGSIYLFVLFTVDYRTYSSMIKFVQVIGPLFYNVFIPVKFLIFWFCSEKFRNVYRSLGPSNSDVDDQTRPGPNNSNSTPPTVSYQAFENDESDVTNNKEIDVHNNNNV